MIYNQLFFFYIGSSDAARTGSARRDRTKAKQRARRSADINEENRESRKEEGGESGGLEADDETSDLNSRRESAPPTDDEFGQLGGIDNAPKSEDDRETLDTGFHEELTSSAGDSSLRDVSESLPADPKSFTVVDDDDATKQSSRASSRSRKGSAEDNQKDGEENENGSDVEGNRLGTTLANADLNTEGNISPRNISKKTGPTAREVFAKNREEANLQQLQVDKNK